MSMTEPNLERAVTYAAPETIDEALALLAMDGDAKVVAGGQSLFVFLRQGLLQPSRLIGLKRIPELLGIEPSLDGGLSIGAMVTQQTLATSHVVTEHYQALSEAAAVVASPLVRRQGTIGGNLCHADPTADPPAALIALGAEVEIASRAGRRRVPIEELFVDYMETALGEDELLVAIHLPPPAPRSGSAYLKHRVRGVDTALVAAAVAITFDKDGLTIEEARIGLAGAGVTPIRARAAEAALMGKEVTSEQIAAATAAASAESEPLSDTEGSEQYRREMIAVVVRRAAECALARARGESRNG
jgi:carbon-monoxide dehydrogenase medium subunit